MVNAKVVAKVNNQETTLLDNQNLTTDASVSLEKTVDGKKTTWFSSKIKGGGGTAPQPNQPPVIDVPASITTKVNVQTDIIARVSDPDGIVDDVNWKTVPAGAIQITQTDGNGLYTAHFIATQAGNLTLEVEAFDDKNARVSKQVKVVVEDVVVTPEPVPTGVIWSSRRDTKLHDGLVRTITKEGNITPGGLGVETRASGSPKIKVNADKTFSLVSGSGGVDNLSIKLRSRHNEGGDCNNRFGGFGCDINRTSIGMKTESCHNNHENSLSKSHGANVFDGKFHTLVFECKNKNGDTAVEFLTKLDGVQKLTGAHNSPKTYYMDKALAEQNSYFWLRLNNSDHGRIYVYARNYNSRLTVVFKMDTANNAIVFQDVTLEAL